ncbi:hypothetical protein Tco_0955431 [Tanacetum coccineum]|uniref:Uncharacterized protein n=1 Tax=Tanacetum coccineum TaxID=301880 RepID=A0ABQ5E792_9ASTR
MDSLYPNTEGASQKVMKGSKSPESVREFMVQDGSRTGQKEDSKALETMMEKVVDWTNHSELNAKYPNECYDCLGLGMGYNRFDWYFEKDAAYPNMDQGITSPLRDLIVEIDDSKFKYGPKQTQPSESESQSSEFDKCESNISAEPSELVSEPVVNESNVECQPKIWSDAPIIVTDYPHRALRIRKCDCGGSSNDWVKNASTPIETQEACQGLKEASDVDSRACSRRLQLLAETHLLAMQKAGPLWLLLYRAEYVVMQLLWAGFVDSNQMLDYGSTS